MTPQKQTWLEAFVSLAWYEVFLRFIANFVAKSAELLLAAGLVVSSANFLTDGAVLVTGSAAFQAWGWIQSLAIDSSLGISFYYVLYCFKQRDWIKFSLYSVLTVLLTLVAGIITDGDIFSHANHAPIHEAMAMLGIDVQLLSILRSVAVVGFVLLSRLRDVSLKDLEAPEHAGRAPTNPVAKDPLGLADPKRVATTHLTMEDVTLLVQILTRSNGTRITEEPPEAEAHSPLALSEPEPSKQLTMEPDTDAQNARTQASEPLPIEPELSVLHQSQSFQEPEPSSSVSMTSPSEPPQAGMEMDREERLEQAYQQLLLEGGAVSARRLAERAHVHRSTCTSWLRRRQSEELGSHESQPSIQEQPPVSQQKLASAPPERDRTEEEEMA